MSDNRRQAAAQLTALLLAVAVVLFGRPAMVSTIGTAQQVEGSAVTHGRSIVVADSTTSRADQGPLTTSASERHSTRHRDRASACVCQEGQAPAAYAYDSTPACRTQLGADSLEAAVTTSATSTTARFVIAAEGMLATPTVGSTKLQNIVNNLYKGTTNPNRVGNGTTMDAIRSELATGAQTGSRWHTIKGQESLNGLNNWLRRNPDAPYGDRLVAQSLADELSAILRGAP